MSSRNCTVPSGADQPVDALSGLAGLALGLVRLHESTGDVRVLDTARTVGGALVGSAVRGPGGVLHWPGPTGAPLAGISHGAAGVALALERLAASTGDGRFAGRSLRAGQTTRASRPLRPFGSLRA